MRKIIQNVSQFSYNTLVRTEDTRTTARRYSLESLVLMFYIFAFTGWIWEVLLHVYMDHAFINRGVMLGPWLPIYGTGGLLILLFLRRFAANPRKFFLMIMLISGVMEYVTASFLEYAFHAKWWDYSDMLFQIHGKVSLAGLLIFGVGGCILYYRLAPWIDRKLSGLSLYTKRGLCIVLTLVFVFDMIYSAFNPNAGRGITTL